MKHLKKVYLSLLLLMMLVLVASPGSVWANMAANTQITNQATLSYNDGSTARTTTAAVTVTVTLVQSTPTVVKGLDQSTQYTGSDTQLNNTFTITATANGPDTYSLTPAITATTNATGASVSITSPVSPVTLGASVVVADSTHTSTTTTIYVPSDGTADSKVNEIAADDWVVVGTNAAVQVQSVTDPGASGIATIVLKTALGSIPTAGMLVAEQQTVTVNVKSGTISTQGTSIVITKTLTIASTTDTTKTVTSDAVTDTFTSGLATFAKFVRNATNAVVGGGATTAYGGSTYYTTGVTAKTGEVLEYIVLVTNSGTGSISSCVVTDGLPVNYASLNTTAYSGSSAVTYVDESNALSYYTAASDTDQATWATPTLTVYVGSGATSSAGGTIASTNVVKVLYQVTVK